MSEVLPRLRRALDVVPSPLPERPGLVLRDPFRYAAETLLVPAHWVPVLSFLDGHHTDLDVQTMLVRRTGGRLVFSDDIHQFVELLRSRGFLETEEFSVLQEKRHAEFRASTERLPVHAGGAYPEDERRLRETLDGRFQYDFGAGEPTKGRLIGLAAPHVSLEGGWDCYVSAYRRLAPSLEDRTFLILGTSHYGAPGRFGLTAKPFRTPLGRTSVDEKSVDLLVRRAPDAVVLDDYCHAIEHSIEFQVVFLQYCLGASVEILPILCGPLGEGLDGDRGGPSGRATRSFLDALAELSDKKEGALFWVLGIDLAHIGQRYGDPVSVRAGEGWMREVAKQDEVRLERVCEGDAEGLAELVNPGADQLKWCGFSALYTFIASLRDSVRPKGRVLRYEQWNIDPHSVVSFAGLEFVGD